ncbi:unnamed protein product, partial [Amoebophrya sp. A120]|eukprot:GSA120T00007108001.1
MLAEQHNIEQVEVVLLWTSTRARSNANTNFYIVTAGFKNSIP